jgi:hypothetical protein
MLAVSRVDIISENQGTRAATDASRRPRAYIGRENPMRIGKPTTFVLLASLLAAT